MKKITILALIAVLLTSTIFAQNAGGQDSKPENSQTRNRERGNRQERADRQDRTERHPPQIQQREVVTVEGTVNINKGFVSVQSGETVYFIPMLNNYARSISELKDGANVSVEGYGFRNMVHPTKITIDGNTYVLLQPALGQGLAFGNPRFDNRRINPRQRLDMRSFNNGRRAMPGNRK